MSKKVEVNSPSVMFGVGCAMIAFFGEPILAGIFLCVGAGVVAFIRWLENLS